MRYSTMPNDPEGMRELAEEWRERSQYFEARGLPNTARDYLEFAAWADTEAERLEEEGPDDPRSVHGELTYRQAHKICRRVIVYDQDRKAVAEDYDLSRSIVDRLVNGTSYQHFNIPCRDEQRRVG